MINLKAPMGWNSWNTFANNINEDLILETADYIVKSGLKDLGYNYVVIDDCWALKTRDENGRLVADNVKFPHGMKYLADKIHEKGLKFGMYSCLGLMTCAGYPSSIDREWIDAQTFASWGVDYLKYDYCYKPMYRKGEDLYRAMGVALANCGREILYSVCNWGADNSHQWIRTTGADIWRSTGDIVDNWNSIKTIICQQLDVLPFGGKGCFNDMDMLVVGMNGNGNVGLGGCNENEYKTHFAAWCMLQSPLMIGADIRKLDKATYDILTNKTLIDINQDEKCAQTFRVDCNGGCEKIVLARYLANGDIALGFFNLTDEKTGLCAILSDIGVSVSSNMTLEMTNCWTNEVVRVENGVANVNLEAHESIVFRAKVVK